MAYENVDTTLLRNSINSLKELNENKTSLMSNYASINSSYWSGNTAVMIKDAMQTLTSYYENINTYLENCLKAADYIDQYKSLEKTNEDYNSRLINTQNLTNSIGEYQISSDSTLNYQNLINDNNLEKIKLEKLINDLINI